MPTKSRPRLRGGNGAAAEAEERIHHRAMRATPCSRTQYRGARRERGRVRAVLVAALDRLVGDEPGVAAAAAVAAAGRQRATFDCVLVLDADRASVERRPAARREVEDELVAVVDEAVAVDRLVVADARSRVSPAPAPADPVDRDRLDPVDRVLELQVLPRRLRDVERRPGVGRLGADVQEQRPVSASACARGLDPGAGPVQVVRRAAACRRSSGSGSRGCRAGR